MTLYFLLTHQVCTPGLSPLVDAVVQAVQTQKNISLIVWHVTRVLGGKLLEPKKKILFSFDGGGPGNNSSKNRTVIEGAHGQTEDRRNTHTHRRPRSKTSRDQIKNASTMMLFRRSDLYVNLFPFSSARNGSTFRPHRP